MLLPPKTTRHPFYPNLQLNGQGDAEIHAVMPALLVVLKVGLEAMVDAADLLTLDVCGPASRLRPDRGSPGARDGVGRTDRCGA
jgi:hypothetical protein